MATAKELAAARTRLADAEVKMTATRQALDEARSADDIATYEERSAREALRLLEDEGR